MFYLIAGAVAAYTVYQLFFADDRDDRPPSRPPQPPVRRRDEWQYQQKQNIDSASHEPPQPPVHRRDERQHQQNIDSASHTESYTPGEAYTSLRTRAKQEGDLMSQCFQQSQEAYERRDRARAKALSDEGKRHTLKMEKLNAAASATIFKGKLVSFHGQIN
jgi:hypothetical protein